MSASATHGGLNIFPTRLNVAHVFCASDFMLKYWLRNNVIRWVFRLTHICLLFEVVSVRPSVRTSTKSFSDFHVIWCVGRPWPHMHTSVTSTRSKVKVRVTELPKLRKVHFSTSISSAVFAWSSKVMVGGDSTGPGLQLIGARFLNFLPGKLSQEFKLCPMSIFHDIPMAVFR